jgi:hypothetical protein
MRMRNRHAPILFGINRPFHKGGVGNSVRNESTTDNLRYLRPNHWQVAVKRLTACRNIKGNGAVNLFQTSPRSPLMFVLGDEVILNRELELRRHLLPRGIYQAIELEILYFTTNITLVDWEIAGGRSATVPLKIFVSSVPVLNTKCGDLLLQVGERDYWLSTDWRSLYSKRPQQPLSAILLPEGNQFASGRDINHVTDMLPGERFQIRLELSAPVVADRTRRQSHTRSTHLRVLQ